MNTSNVSLRLSKRQPFSDLNPKETSKQSKKTQINEKQKVKIDEWNRLNYLEQRSNHVQLARINPIHQYNDPRKASENKDDLVIVSKQMKIKENNYCANAGQKMKSISEHLVSPYVYIKKIINKHSKTKEEHDNDSQHVEHRAQTANPKYNPNHPDIWNMSNILESKRQIRQESKGDTLEMAMKAQKGDFSNSPKNKDQHHHNLNTSHLSNVSANGRGERSHSEKMLSSSMMRLSKEDRERMYKENANLEKYMHQMFEDIEECIEKQLFTQPFKKHVGPSDSLKQLYMKFAKFKVLYPSKKIKSPVFQDLPVNKEQFIDFLLHLGYNKNKTDFIEKIFNFCKEEHKHWMMKDNSQLHQNDVQKNEKMSMRAFIFNFKKYQKQKQDIHHILNFKTAVSRIHTLQGYFQNQKNGYKELKQYVRQVNEDENKSRLTILDKIKELEERRIEESLSPSRRKQTSPEKSALNKKFNELMLNSKEQKQEEARLLQKHVFASQVLGKQVGKSTEQEELDMALKEFDQLSLSKSRKYQEKVLLTKFLQEQATSSDKEKLISLSSLDSALHDLEHAKEESLRVVSEFLHRFKDEKTYFGEKSFTFLEMATFLHSKEYVKLQIQEISAFLLKVKKFFLLQQCAFSKGSTLENKINAFDPNQHIPVKLMDVVFEIRCNKATFQHEVIQRCLNKLAILCSEWEGRLQPKNKHLRNIFEANVLLDGTSKYLLKIDEQLFALISRVENVAKLLRNHDLDKNGVRHLLHNLRQEQEAPLSQQQQKAASPLAKFISQKSELPEQQQSHAQSQSNNSISTAQQQLPVNGYKKPSVFTNPIQAIPKKTKESESEQEGLDLALLLNPVTVAPQQQQQLLHQKYEKIKQKDKDKGELDLHKMMHAVQPSNASNQAQPKNMPQSILKNTIASGGLHEYDVDDAPLTISQAFESDGFKKFRALDHQENAVNANLAESVHFNKQTQPQQSQKQQQSPTLGKVREQLSFLESDLKDSSAFNQEHSLDGSQSLNVSQVLMNIKKNKFEEAQQKANKEQDYQKQTQTAQAQHFANIQKPHLAQSVEESYFLPGQTDLGKDFRQRSNQFLDYKMYLPTEYYNFIISNPSPNKNEKLSHAKQDPQWYIRSHHIETLTENPQSHQDNVMSSHYKSYLDSLKVADIHKKQSALDSLKQQDRKQQLHEQIIDESSLEAKKKQGFEQGDADQKRHAISQLEAKIQELRNEVEYKKALSQAHMHPNISKAANNFTNSVQSYKQQKMPDQIIGLEKYYNRLENKSGKDLLYSTYESQLNEIRLGEKDILLKKRNNELQTYGVPKDRWWEEKGVGFTNELKKYDRLHNRQSEKFHKLADQLSVKELY